MVDHNRTYPQVLESWRETSLDATFTHGLHPISQARDGDAEVFLSDGHGNTTALIDETGSFTDSYRYDAFGSLLGEESVGAPSYGYAGEQHDADLGMIYLRARYYDPEIGRFHRMDDWPGNPAEPTTLHKYLYANANPVMGKDPSGLFTLTEISVTQSNICEYV